MDEFFAWLAAQAIRSPAMNRRNALFAGHNEGGRNRARFASLIGTCKMNGVEPYEYICKIWTSEPERFILNPIHQMPGLNT